MGTQDEQGVAGEIHALAGYTTQQLIDELIARGRVPSDPSHDEVLLWALPGALKKQLTAEALKARRVG